MAAKLKKGDQVIVIAGRDRGLKGAILSVNPTEGRAIVEGVNTVTRHTKQTQGQEGGRIKKPAPIDLSNLMLLDPKTSAPTRVGFKEVDGKKVRFAKQSGEVIDG